MGLTPIRSWLFRLFKAAQVWVRVRASGELMVVFSGDHKAVYKTQIPADLGKRPDTLP